MERRDSIIFEFCGGHTGMIAHWMKRLNTSSEELLGGKITLLQNILFINVTSFKKRLVLPCLW